MQVVLVCCCPLLVVCSLDRCIVDALHWRGVELVGPQPQCGVFVDVHQGVSLVLRGQFHGVDDAVGCHQGDELDVGTVLGYCQLVVVPLVGKRLDDAVKYEELCALSDVDVCCVE